MLRFGGMRCCDLCACSEEWKTAYAFLLETTTWTRTMALNTRKGSRPEGLQIFAFFYLQVHEFVPVYKPRKRGFRQREAHKGVKL